MTTNEERDRLIGVVADAMRAAEPNDAKYLPLDALKYEEAAAVAVDAVLGAAEYEYAVIPKRATEPHHSNDHRYPNAAEARVSAGVDITSQGWKVVRRPKPAPWEDLT